ncbi:MAG: GTPase HflX [Clostridia bacterium]
MEYTNTSERKERVVLAGVHTGSKNVIEDTNEQSLEELGRLVDTAGAEVVGSLLQNKSYIESSTYIGEGKVEELKAACETLDADIVIFDDELTGSQVRNLEKLTGKTVIDRSMLILDIFAARALTKEGKIQVELAQLKYMIPRLIGIGASLSRLGGGIGTRGPGETKLETDRRHIRSRIGHLEKELKEIKKHRELLRSRRKKEGIPVAALVGYTNAGKSSLLNILTNADVLVEDKLFATLDPTARSIELSDGRKVLLVDTVGFIRKLPHHLIEAFKSTLEEAVLADVLIHVVDSSSEEIEQHIAVVNNLLNELGAENKPIITVYNKIDLKRDDLRLPEAREEANRSIEISALTGKGIDKLLEILEDVVPGKKTKIRVCIPYWEGNMVSQVHEECDVLNEEYAENGTIMDIYVDSIMFGRLKKYVVGSDS